MKSKPTHPGFWSRRAERLHLEAAQRLMRAKQRLADEALMQAAQATVRLLALQISPDERGQLDTLLPH